MPATNKVLPSGKLREGTFLGSFLNRANDTFERSKKKSLMRNPSLRKSTARFDQRLAENASLRTAHARDDPNGSLHSERSCDDALQDRLSTGTACCKISSVPQEWPVADRSPQGIVKKLEDCMTQPDQPTSTRIR